MTDDIVKILIGQHRILQQGLVSVSQLAQIGESAVQEIIMGLKSFSGNLLGHLKLENEEFYPKLLDAMKAKNMDTLDTEKFIAEMKSIEMVVMAFLQKFNNVDAFKGNMGDFIKELTATISALNLRIESEETGVYTYWEGFGAS